jgi:hypothetical protein
VRSDFPGDELDVTAQNVMPAGQQLALQSGRGPVKDIAPRGGALSATVAVDASSGQLKDANALAAALNSVLPAYTGSILPAPAVSNLIGGGPINGLAMGRVTFDAVREPATMF